MPAKYWYGRLSGGLEDEMKFLQYLIKPQDRVVDVGGNRGVYAYRLWHLGAQVEVFEPNPVCFNVLCAWANGKQRVRLHRVALSNQSGSANLHIPVDGAGLEHDASASIERAGFGQSRDEPVALQTLDSFNLDRVSLIKIDVEGHEYSVVEGAAATVLGSRPALLIEIEQRHSGRAIEEVFAKVQGFGYQGFFLDGGRLVGIDNFVRSRHQSMTNFGTHGGVYVNNFLFLHRDRLALGEYLVLLGGAPGR